MSLGVESTGRSSRGRVGGAGRSTGVTLPAPPLGSVLRLTRGSVGSAGLTTAPVGLAFDAPLSLGVVVAETGSRPLKIRERRRSLSSGTPGVRVAAPVGRRSNAAAGSGRAVPAAAVLFLGITVGLIDKSRKGFSLITRRARSLLAGCGRAVRLPKSRAGTAVTARR